MGNASFILFFLENPTINTFITKNGTNIKTLVFSPCTLFHLPKIQWFPGVCYYFKLHYDLHSCLLFSITLLIGINFKSRADLGTRQPGTAQGPGPSGGTICLCLLILYMVVIQGHSTSSLYKIYIYFFSYMCLSLSLIFTFYFKCSSLKER